MSTSTLFIAGMITFMVIAQVMFKFAGNYIIGHDLIISTLIFNPWLWLGLLATLFGMICWLFTLRKLPLAIAYPWTALIYVITPFVSSILFNDILNTKYLLGLCSIILGVLLTTWSAKTR